MPKQKIQSLISDLHEKYGDDLISPQQKALIADLNAHIHDMNEAEPVSPDFIDTIDIFITQIEEEHPNAAVIVNKILETLKNIGV